MLSYADCPKHHYLVLANPSAKSFCHAVARTYVDEVLRQGQTAEICDLYGIALEPALRIEESFTHGDRHHPWVEAELKRVHASGALILVYPIWFGGPPAILKGYVDRVLGAHCGFRRFSEGGAQAAISGRYLLSVTTSGTSLDWLQERGQPRALRAGFDIYLERGFGLRDAGHVDLDEIVPNMSSARATHALAKVAEAAQMVCGLLFTSEEEPPATLPTSPLAHARS